jgi:hypothetical protein
MPMPIMRPLKIGFSLQNVAYSGRWSSSQAITSRRWASPFSGRSFATPPGRM